MSVAAVGTRPSSTAWLRARRVLAVRLDNLGDVLMTTPALAALRETLPDAHITLLTSPAAARATPHLDMVDETLAFAAPWMKTGQADSTPPGAAELALLAQLRARAFDAAVVFTVCTQSALPAALLCRMAGIPLRLGIARENPYALLSDWVREPDEPIAQARHEVARQLALVATVGMQTADTRLRWRVRDADRQEVAQALAAQALTAQALSAQTPAAKALTAAGVDTATPYLLLHPGATAPSRRWPPERFGIAADAIAADSGCAVVFCGGADEAALVDAARAAMRGPSVSLAGRLSLGGLAAAIAGASAVLANNSGPAHLAAAVGTPVAVLYALTNPQHTPWAVPHRVLAQDVDCRWCLRSVCPRPGHDCLTGVAPQQAAQAVLALMEQTRSHVPRRVA